MDDATPSIAVLLADPAQASCRQLADHLQLPLVSLEQTKGYPYVLAFTEQGLALQQTGAKAAGPVLVNFDAGASGHRRKFGGGELIVKAVGGNKSQLPSVLDATAGLGRDSFVLACANYSLQLCERSPIVAALLADGLLRAEQGGDMDLQQIVRRMQLHHQDALAYLRNEGHANPPDVIVIDPMFPESKKSALVKKDMRAFHTVVGADADSDQLLNAALECARHRVVVKRPKKAEWLAGEKPNFSVAGKAIRFDIYSLKAFGKA
jgi:16S rRNA (guanine1516-N2)-methyltransferase